MIIYCKARCLQNWYTLTEALFAEPKSKWGRYAIVNTATSTIQPEPIYYRMTTGYLEDDWRIQAPSGNLSPPSLSLLHGHEKDYHIYLCTMDLMQQNKPFRWNFGREACNKSSNMPKTVTLTPSFGN